MTKDSVRGALDRLTAWLAYRGARVRHVILPDGPDGTKVGLDDYLAAGHTTGDLRALACEPDRARQKVEPTAAEQTTLPPAEPRTLEQTVAVFRKWLHLDDPAPLYALAAALVANRAPGDPVWLLLVCAPSTGKTELLSAATRLPWVRPASTLTASSLPSGTSAKDRAKDATGGLLRQVGAFGVLLCKDFTSLLAQNRDTRPRCSPRCARCTKDAGTALSARTAARCSVGPASAGWSAASRPRSTVTPQSSRRSVTGSCCCGCPTRTLRHPRRWRCAIAGWSPRCGPSSPTRSGLVSAADTSAVNRELSEAEQEELVRLASFTARGRTGVERDGYTRDVLYLPQVEGPGRLVTAYARLLGALTAIGCGPELTWDVLARVALDCIPASRARFARELLHAEVPERTSDLAATVGMTTRNAREHLDDLALLGLADRTKTSDAANAPDYWMATKTLRDLWPQTRPEMYPPSPTPQEKP